MTSDTALQPGNWESTFPHFSAVEKHGRITVPIHQPSETVWFFVVISFILWVPITVWAAFWVHGLAHHSQNSWLGMAMILCSFVPVIVSGIAADEARDTFGQRRTGNWIAVIPALAGIAVGLLGAALWFRDFSGGVMALVSMVSSAGAVAATLTAWRGVRYIRRRQHRLAALRSHGVRSPGVLRTVEFLGRWTGDDPAFTVTVAFDGAHGRRTVTANMVTSAARVPKAGTAVVVFSAPHDTGTDVLIELDPDRPVRFDPDRTGRYRKPSGN